MNKNNLTHTFRSAYRSGHSMETARLRVFGDLLLSADIGNASVLTLLNLSAAFDTSSQTGGGRQAWGSRQAQEGRQAEDGTQAQGGRQAQDGSQAKDSGQAQGGRQAQGVRQARGSRQAQDSGQAQGGRSYSSVPAVHLITTV